MNANQIAEAVERVQSLAELIRYHADLYYNVGKPEVSDAEFDQLVVELGELVGWLRTFDPENSAISVGEAALNEVGSVPSYGKKVTHGSTMGSLEKETSFAGVKGWAGKYSGSTTVAVTPKIDGLAIRLNYRFGKLEEAATRGTGQVGQDIIDNIRAMASIPKVLPAPITVEVRGEVYMKKSVHAELAKTERSFANPRNAASGSLLNKDPNITARRKLDFLAYDAILPVADPASQLFATEQDKRTWMTTNLSGIDLVEMQIIDLQHFDALAVEWEAKRPGLDYQIDGLVVALNSLQEQEEAGWNGTHAPRGKIAYKFRPEQKTARVTAIDWQVGRTGRLCPMARIEPTLLDGSTISNITLHNAANVSQMDIAVGDEVLIEKAGDIIPQVVRVVGRNDRKVVHSSDPDASIYPSKCPSCGEPVVYDDKSVNLWCHSATCPAKLEERVLHYVKTLDILGVGAGIVSGLCRAGFVKDIPDLYYLTQEQVIEVTGGVRAAEKVITAILEKNQIPLAMFLDALGIDGLGTTTSKDVAKKLKKLSHVMALRNPVILTAIEGIGDLTAKKIVVGLETMGSTVEQLVRCIDVLDVQDATGPLVGKSFCLTGAMSKPRKDIEKAIEAAGGEVRSSVGKGLTYLVQADASSTSSKSEKAKKLGTLILGEVELREMMGV